MNNIKNSTGNTYQKDRTKVQYIPIFNNKLAGILLQKDFKLNNVSEDKKGNAKMVYWFSYNIKIYDEIDKFRNKSNVQNVA